MKIYKSISEKKHHNLFSFVNIIDEKTKEKLKRHLKKISSRPNDLFKSNSDLPFVKRLNGYVPCEIDQIKHEDVIDIPENVTWCVKSEFKNKEGQNKLSQIGINVSNFLVNLLGGEPKTVFCDTNEFVIETTPNKSGSVRSTNIIIPGKGIINVSQDK